MRSSIHQFRLLTSNHRSAQPRAAEQECSATRRLGSPRYDPLVAAKMRRRIFHAFINSSIPPPHLDSSPKARSPLPSPFNVRLISVQSPSGDGD